MSLSTKDQRTLYFMIHTEWIIKTNPPEAANKINKKMGIDNLVTSAHIHYWYKHFNKGINNIPITKFYSVQQQLQKTSVNSPLLLIDGGEETYTSNGRFLIYPYCGYQSRKLSISVHDLFHQTTRKTDINVDVELFSFKVAGEYLLALEDYYKCNKKLGKLYVFKINHNDLSVEKLGTIDFYVCLSGIRILPDQLNSQKFVISCGCHGPMICQIKNDEIVSECIKDFEKIDLYNIRFIGNKLQGFIENNDEVLKFCEINLDKKERTEMDAPMNFDHDRFSSENSSVYNYCWSSDYFYGFYEIYEYEIEWREQYQLLSFDSKSLKWSVIQIYASMPETMFVDENEVLTFYVREFGVGFYYRVALRKPDSLKNLTLIFAAREFNLYGDDKYVKVTRQINC